MQVIENNALFTQVAVEESSFVSGGSGGGFGLVETASALTITHFLFPSYSDNSHRSNSKSHPSIVGDVITGNILTMFLLR
ncbi:hypothetical protein WJM97_00165 [Okeanomitos corallinicola TIOX110]|uniref:Uncharacterized protein n=1 Tax=Okeanomitos corallinicola TIOX110 TaxID=3133117 RepID=A0ABZ2US01_9CYAN